MSAADAVGRTGPHTGTPALLRRIVEQHGLCQPAGECVRLGYMGRDNSNEDVAVNLIASPEYLNRTDSTLRGVEVLG